MKLYIKTKNNEIVEACSVPLEGAEEIACTEDDWNKIRERFVGVVDKGKIKSFKDGKDRAYFVKEKARKDKDEADQKALEEELKNQNLTK